MGHEKPSSGMALAALTPNQHAGKPIGRRSPETVDAYDARTLQAGKRRRAAADWIEDLTGIAVSATSDKHFRECLKDGTLLCQVLNIIRPGCITQVSPLTLALQGSCCDRIEHLN